MSKKNFHKFFIKNVQVLGTIKFLEKKFFIDTLLMILKKSEKKTVKNFHKKCAKNVNFFFY